MQLTLIRPCTVICVAIPFFCFVCFAKTERAVNSITPPSHTSSKSGKNAIEQFMMLTALYLMELEWNAGYANRNPDRAGRVKAMISADLSKCPQDFQEAWLKQVENPRRNYAAPLFRKYGISLASLRKRTEKDLAAIDSSIHPPVPLFDEEESVSSYDLRSCGSRENILKATSLLKTKLYGIDPKMAPLWSKAIKRVMMEFSLNYIEAMVRLQFKKLSPEDVDRLFKEIKLEQCPPDFRKAWEHDLPFFINGQFGSPVLRTAPTALRYEVDDKQIMDLIRTKMKEWEISMPNEQSLPKFIQEMQDLKTDLLSYR